jgi:O-antigen biosynthesis protein WbqP
MKRIFDLLLSLCLVPVLLFPILVIAVLVRLTSKGPVFYWPGSQFKVQGSRFKVRER